MHCVTHGNLLFVTVLLVTSQLLPAYPFTKNGPILGYQDPSHFYYVHIAAKADAHANSIFIVNGKPRVSIATERTDGTDWGTDYHDVRIVRNCATGAIKVHYDDMDKPVMRAQDDTFKTGRLGFGSFDDTGNIDDVLIWGVTPRTPGGSD